MTVFYAKTAKVYSTDTERLLEIFGLQGRQVAELDISLRPGNCIMVVAEFMVTEDELAAMRAEFEKSPPVQQEFLGLSQRLSEYQPNQKEENK